MEDTPSQIDWASEPLFKYMKADHATTTIAEGIFRIGTLHEHQSMEYGAEVGDMEEGTKQYVPNLANIRKLSDFEFVQQYPRLVEAMKAPADLSKRFRKSEQECRLLSRCVVQIVMFIA